MTEKKLPAGWEEKKLGEYLYLKNGYAFKRSAYIEKSNNSVPIIRISDINGNTASDELAIHTTEKVEGFELQKGDLLIAMSGVTTGKLGIYIGNTPAYQNQRVGNLKLKNEGCEEFRNHLMFYLQDEVRKLGYGNAQPNISGKMLEDLDIVLPPLPEQQKLAQKFTELLSMVDHIKQKLESIPPLLKTYRQAVLAKAVSGELSSKWREENKISRTSWKNTKVEDISTVTPKKDKISDDLRVSFSSMHLMSENINQHLNFEKKLWSEVKKGFSFFKNGDVLLAKITPCFENGKSAVARNLINGIGTGSTEFMVFRPNSELLSDFLYLHFNTDKFRQEGSMNMTGSVGHRRVPKEFVLNWEIELPPREEQKFIVQQVEELLNFAEKLEQQAQQALAKVNLLKQAILAKGFRGELMME